MAIYDVNGNLIPTGVRQTNEVLVASSEAPASIKESAEYLCTGTNDERVIQQAVNYIANNGGGIVKLSCGTFYISSFPSTDSAGDYYAIVLPVTTDRYAIEIAGAMYPYGTGSKTVGEKGTRIQVTGECYEGLDSTKRYTILRGGYLSSQIWQNARHHLTLRDISFRLPYNQKPITCLDLKYTNRVLVERVEFRAFISGYNGRSVSVSNPPDVAVQNCVGMRATSGSNNGVLNDYRNILATGFYEGFKLGGEHLIGINLSAIFCVYGYTFGNYSWDGAFSHPITLINCCDERGVNLPKFVDCGLSGTAFGAYGTQSITLIDFNIERRADYAPGGVLGDRAIETTPGLFRGNINYTVSTTSAENKINEAFWEDGSGINFTTKNDAHSLRGTSSIRQQYKPTYMQSYYDTTVNKMLWCIDTATPTWVDAQGNTVT